MRKTGATLTLILAALVAFLTFLPGTADAKVKQTFARVTTTTAKTFTFYTADADVAHVTITADSGTPDGTVTIYARQTADGSRTLLYTASNPASGTVTYSGQCQGVLEVVFASVTTGTLGLEVMTR